VPLLLEAYEDGPAICQEYDPRAPAVAEEVASAIRHVRPDAEIEHVGSTAVPGCAGKGIVDLLVTYPPGALPEVLSVLDALGFQPQSAGNPFPPDRPMRCGTLRHEGVPFRVHAHVRAAGTPEAAALVQFRDRLRADPRLRDEYVARKRSLIESGVTDTRDYSNAKTGFIRAAIGGSEKP
jgi:GrpB-like predicted nucleotidyltransferase (UPF0157 family)